MAKSKLQPGEGELKNAKHELFSMLYAGLASKQYFGNATRCYLHVYGGEERIVEIENEINDTYDEGSNEESDNERRRLKTEKKTIENNARSAGTRLLLNVAISHRTDWLLDQYLKDEMADREMAYVMAQREDLQSKVAAYREIAKVKSRVRAGSLTGEFEFSWEGDEEDAQPTKKHKRPKVRATVSVGKDDEDMQADFQ